MREGYWFYIFSKNFNNFYKFKFFVAFKMPKWWEYTVAFFVQVYFEIQMFISICWIVEYFSLISTNFLPFFRTLIMFFRKKFIERLKTLSAKLSPNQSIKKRMFVLKETSLWRRILTATYLYWLFLILRLYMNVLPRKAYYFDEFDIALRILKVNFHPEHRLLTFLALSTFPLFVIAIHYMWDHVVWTVHGVKQFFLEIFYLEQIVQNNEKESRSISLDQLEKLKFIRIRKPETIHLKISFYRKCHSFFQYCNTVTCKYSLSLKQFSKIFLFFQIFTFYCSHLGLIGNCLLQRESWNLPTISSHFYWHHGTYTFHSRWSFVRSKQHCLLFLCSL